MLIILILGCKQGFYARWIFKTLKKISLSLRLQTQFIIGIELFPERCTTLNLNTLLSTHLCTSWWMDSFKIKHFYSRSGPPDGQHKTNSIFVCVSFVFVHFIINFLSLSLFWLSFSLFFERKEERKNRKCVGKGGEDDFGDVGGEEI